MSVDITLSAKRLIPLVQITYEKKAPAFAHVDDIIEKLQKHYGKIYEKPSEFVDILKDEQTLELKGKKLCEFSMNDTTYVLRKVSLEDESFHE